MRVVTSSVPQESTKSSWPVNGTSEIVARQRQSSPNNNLSQPRFPRPVIMKLHSILQALKRSSRQRKSRLSKRSVGFQSLETRSMMTALPLVTMTTPSLGVTGSVADVPAGVNSIKVDFNQTMTNLQVGGNFELRAAGVDNVFGTNDDVLRSITSSASNAATTLRFNQLPTGSYRLTVTDRIGITNASGFTPLDGDANGVAGGNFVRSFRVVPGPATKFDVITTTTTGSSGSSMSVTVRALDASNNLATGYTGAVAFTTNNVGAGVPPAYTFTARDGGLRTFSVRMGSAATGVWIKVTDSLTGFNKSVTGITVTPASMVVSGFGITGYPSPTEAGVSNNFLLSALDANGLVLSPYSGTVRFTSSDPGASIPADYIFTGAERGTRTFSATFTKAGLQTLTATAVATGVSRSILLNVTPSVLKTFQISGYPATVNAGTANNFSVAAVDRYNNRITDYVGTVTFTSSDTLAILPVSYTFVPGDSGFASFSATMRSIGTNRSITVTDTATGLFGRQSGIFVDKARLTYNATSRIIYIDRVTATLSNIKAAVLNVPLTLVDPVNKIWKLDATVIVTNGGKLVLHGSSLGGDVNELRLRSENSTAAGSIIEIRADYGTIDINSTKILSWNNAANGGLGGPDTEYGTFKRSFIRARSKLAADGVTRLESRMDIANSDISYLGYHGAEAYGLSWKVIGTPGANNELFDKVDVYGNIVNNYIHHLYFGVYTFGAYGMLMSGNEVAYNVGYGLDPHDDSDFLIIENNYVHHNGNHGIIASKRCNNVIIRNNISSFNNGHGIMLHRNSDYGLIEGNTVEGNGQVGIAIFDSRFITIRQNIVKGNNDGIRFSVGAANNIVEFNTITNSVERGINFFKGSDPPSPGDNGRPKNNTFRNNNISGSGREAIRLLESDSNLFESNVFLGIAGIVLRFQLSLGNTLRNNTLLSPGSIILVGTSATPTSLILQNQANVTVSRDAFSTVTYV